MKNFFLTDKEIQDLINEPKKMDRSANSILQGMKIKSGRAASMQQNSYQFPRSNGEGEWSIYLRLSKLNGLDFSCGLGFIPKGRKQVFTLMRYNGKNHQHTNQLEDETTFYDFHIHIATEKYQKSSYDDEHYAMPTDRYADLNMAFRCLLNDCKVITDDSNDKQTRLFE